MIPEPTQRQVAPLVPKPELAKSGQPSAAGEKVEAVQHPDARSILLDATQQALTVAYDQLQRSEAGMAAAQRLTHMGSWDIELINGAELEKCPTRWSDEMYRIFGYQPQQFEPSCARQMELVDPEDRARVARSLTDLIDESIPYDVCYRIILGTGQYRVVHERAERRDTGPERRLFGTVHDITERVRSDEARRQSEERFEIFFRSSPLPMAYANTGPAGFIDVNEQWVAFFGYSREEIIGWTDQDRGLWADSIERQSFLARLEADGVVQSFECHFRRKDGEIRDALLWVEVLQLGATTIHLSTVMDVTDRKKNEDALRLTSRVLESMVEGVTVWDQETRAILFSNPASDAMFGYGRGEMIGRSLDRITDLSPVEWRAFFGQVVDELQRAGAWRGEVPNRKKDGTPIVTRAYISPLGFGGRKCGITVREDITATKLLESQFLRAQRMESLGRLASGIAHDMNNILAPIMMVPPLLRTACLTPEALEKMLRTVEISAERGTHLVRQLLYFGRGVESQRVFLRPKDSVSQVEEILAETFPKHIAIVTDVVSDAWPVRADPTQLHQVILNLCVNALDAMPDGGTLTIRVRNVDVTAKFPSRPADATDGPHIVLSVIDTGTGISPKHLEKIFDPFFTTKGAGKGTGLGLSTVLGIVKNHRGFVMLETEVGHGSAFHVHLPAIPNATSQASPNINSHSPMGDNQLVLLVDDEVAFREIARELLNRNRYQVVTANDGQEAFELFKNRPDEIQLVITDVDMPSMDGIQLTRLLKTTHADIKVIVVTGKQSSLDGEDRAIELERSGLAARLAKPFTPEQFLTLVQRVLATEK